jgi:hypothetical protein
MSRPFDFSQMPSDGIVILPELPPDPALGDALTVNTITGGRVQLKFAAVTGGGTGSFLPLAGGTLTGPLTLSGPPTVNLHASTKQYVDSQITSTLGTVGANYLALSGGTLTGSLILPATAPINALQAVNKDYVDTKVAAVPAGVTSFNARAGAVFLSSADVSTALGLLTTGGTMTAALNLSTSLPTADLQAASKGYVDDQVATVAAVGIATLQYNASTVTTAANPGNGSVRWNTLMMYDATAIYISNKASDSTDWANFFRKQVVGTKVSIQLKNDSTKICRFFMTGPMVDNVGWFTIPVTFLGAGGYQGMPFAGGTNVVVAFLGTASNPDRNYARLQAQWQNAATVSDDTVWLAYDAPYAGTVTGLTYFTGNGSFNVNIQINGTSVTGLAAVAVSSSTPATTAATAANTFSAGQRITAVLTGSTGAPTDALLSLAVTWS